MKNEINTMAKHANSTEQGIILLQKNFTELGNDSFKKSIHIWSLCRTISSMQSDTRLIPHLWGEYQVKPGTMSN